MQPKTTRRATLRAQSGIDRTLLFAKANTGAFHSGRVLSRFLRTTKKRDGYTLQVTLAISRIILAALIALYRIIRILSVQVRRLSSTKHSADLRCSLSRARSPSSDSPNFRHLTDLKLIRCDEEWAH